MSTFLRNFGITIALLGSTPVLCLTQVSSAPATDSPLAALLREAARINSQIPDRLRAYRAHIETEMSVVVLDSGGRERSTQIEQIASDVRWRAPDRYDQRVVGYRSQSIGPTFSLMSFFGGWTVPTRNGKVTIKAGSRVPGVSGASFVELVNQEVDGQYWLPAFQRTEIQARIALLGDFRTVLRIVSRFDDYRANDSSWTGPEARPGVRHNLTFASNSSQQRFRDWRRPIGAASSDVYYGELNDLAPAEWSTTAEADRTRSWPRTLGEVFRFNRIEGAFTGLAIQRELGDSISRVSLYGSAGWAWSEQTARGNFGIERRSGGTTSGLRFERALANTNDFKTPFSFGATLSALLGSTDNFDYLDRWAASASVSKALGLKQRSLISLQIGPGEDRAVQQHISQGIYVAKGEGFRPNRGIREWKYFRTVASLDLNPEVSGMFVDRGVGARLHYERADGAVYWQRLEGRLAARREVGPFQLYARGDAGTLLGKPAPHVLFELGGDDGLTAYRYKEFACDNAALARAVLGYTFPFLRAPMRLPSQLILPGLAPGLAAGIHGGWAEISGAAAQRALLELGTTIDTTTRLPVPD